MEEQIAQVLASAKAKRNAGDFRGAIEELEAFIAANIENRSIDGALRPLVADVYGALGGNYNRAGDFAGASASYAKGIPYETNTTYNLSNKVVNAILADATRLPDQVKDIRRVLEVAEAREQADFWLWADIGQFHLLNNDYDAAIDAYGHFKQLNPPDWATESTVRVLKQLQTALQKPFPDIADKISKGIEFLA